VLKGSYDKSKGSAFVVFKVVGGKPNSIEVIYLEQMRLIEINAETLEQKLSKYLSTKDNDQILQPGSKTSLAQPAKPTPRKASATGYSDPNDIRDEQQMNYQRMIEEVNRKAEAERQKQEDMMLEELSLQKKMVSMQRRLRLKKETYIANLPPEPTGDGVIKIALRLPDGTRLQRAFNKTDSVEVKCISSSQCLASCTASINLICQTNLTFGGTILLSHSQTKN
jgi:UBX domain